MSLNKDIGKDYVVCRSPHNHKKNYKCKKLLLLKFIKYCRFLSSINLKLSLKRWSVEIEIQFIPEKTAKLPYQTDF